MKRSDYELEKGATSTGCEIEVVAQEQATASADYHGNVLQHWRPDQYIACSPH